MIQPDFAFGQLVFFIAQGALLVFSGVMSLLLRGAAKRLDDLTKAVRDLGNKVEGQGRDLARGDERFRDLERRVGDLEERMREHERDSSVPQQLRTK